MKTKKISKQSLVIAVLSLLLVLSMGLYATGAYFTDTTGAGKATGTLTFGTVKVDATYGDGASENKTSYAGYIVPGDQYFFAGTLTPAGTVEMLVAVQFEYTLQIVGKVMTLGANDAVTLANSSTTYNVDDLYKGATGTDNKAMEATAAQFAVNGQGVSGWTEITDSALTPYGLAEGVRLFKVTGNVDGTGPTTPATPITYNCSFVLDAANCGNIVHGSATIVGSQDAAADKVFVLNYNGHDAYQSNYVNAETIALTSTIKVGAIQSRVGQQDFNAAAAGTQLTNLLNGITVTPA